MLTVTASTAQAPWLGGDAIVLTASGWPAAAMTARLTSAGGTHYPCISARVGQQSAFYALGATLLVYTPQLPASAASYTLEVLNAAGTVIAQVPVAIGAPQYGSSTFGLRALLPVNYAAGATSLSTIDQEGY